MAMGRQLTIHAQWEDEASVWVAESEDVPGLITEAESADALREKLKVLIPELLEANHCLPPGETVVNMFIQYHREERTAFHVAA